MLDEDNVRRGFVKDDSYLRLSRECAAAMLISGHRTDSVYRRYNIIDMEVIKEATAKIEEHQRALNPENNHRTATPSAEIGADDKTDPVN
jgi:hypothetical protein